MECPNCGQDISPEAQHCKWCGTIVPPSQHLLEDSGIVPRSTPTPAAASSLPPVPLATVGDRCVALLLDTAIVAGLAAVFDVWLFLRWGRATSSDLELTLAAVVVAAVVDLLLCFVYMWLLEAVFGATLGKAIIGIRVMNESHHSDLSASAIRNALRLVDSLGFYLIGTLVASCSSMRRRLGDICAGTLVIVKEFRPAVSTIAVVLWLGVLGTTLWLVPHLCSRGPAGQPPRYLGRTAVQMGRSATSAYVRVGALKVEVQFGAAPTPAPGPAPVQTSASAAQ